MYLEMASNSHVIKGDPLTSTSQVLTCFPDSPSPAWNHSLKAHKIANTKAELRETIGLNYCARRKQGNIFETFSDTDEGWFPSLNAEFIDAHLKITYIQMCIHTYT